MSYRPVSDNSLHETKTQNPFFCNYIGKTCAGILFPDARKTHIILALPRSIAPLAFASRGLRPRRVCPFSEVAPTIPEILNPSPTVLAGQGKHCAIGHTT
jgi:hypothetical protein